MKLGWESGHCDGRHTAYLVTEESSTRSSLIIFGMDAFHKEEVPEPGFAELRLNFSSPRIVIIPI
jgi:hypothetical protein